jgi:tetrahydromethanopterin S-methyltransferase subunit G
MTKQTAFDVFMGSLDHTIDGSSPPPPDPPGIAGFGGSDHNGGMEARIGKLEDFAHEARERLARVETKIDHIDREVSQVKWWIVAQIAALFVAVIGTGIAIQQMTVATFQGAAQVAKESTPQAATPPPIIINVPQGASTNKP